MYKLCFILLLAGFSGSLAAQQTLVTAPAPNVQTTAATVDAPAPPHPAPTSNSGEIRSNTAATVSGQPVTAPNVPATTTETRQNARATVSGRKDE